MIITSLLTGGLSCETYTQYLDTSTDIISI